MELKESKKTIKNLRMDRLLIIFLICISFGCSKNESNNVRGGDNQDETPISESQFVKNAKKSLSEKLESTFKKGTKPENMEILYLNEKDSICVIGFNCVIKKASGRTIRGKCEYVYNPQKEYIDEPYLVDLSKFNFDGWIVFLDNEKSIIEKAKDFADEVEMDTPPEKRHESPGWEDCMFETVAIERVRKVVEL